MLCQKKSIVTNFVGILSYSLKTVFRNLFDLVVCVCVSVLFVYAGWVFVAAIQLMWACGLAAGFLGFYSSTHLPTYDGMDS